LGVYKLDTELLMWQTETKLICEIKTKKFVLTGEQYKKTKMYKNYNELSELKRILELK